MDDFSLQVCGPEGEIEHTMTLIVSMAVADLARLGCMGSAGSTWKPGVNFVAAPHGRDLEALRRSLKAFGIKTVAAAFSLGVDTGSGQRMRRGLRTTATRMTRFHKRVRLTKAMGLKRKAKLRMLRAGLPPGAVFKARIFGCAPLTWMTCTGGRTGCWGRPPGGRPACQGECLSRNGPSAPSSIGPVVCLMGQSRKKLRRWSGELRFARSA